MLRLIADEDLSWPLNKKKGEEFEIGSGFANTLMLLHKAHRAPDKPAKRKYQRRDMTAEDNRSMAVQASAEDDI